MSVLNKMKSLVAQQSAQLVKVHVLAEEPMELRLQYLACVALAVAIDREPNVSERHAFNGLARSMRVDEPDAKEQLNERASVTEEDMMGLFSEIRDRDMEWCYLLDVAWLHVADGALDANELAFMEIVTPLLTSAAPEDVKGLQDFVLAVKEKALLTVAKKILVLPKDEIVQTLLPDILWECFPFVGILHGRWIDHGDGTVTDTTSGLMWARFLLGQGWENGKVVGKRYSQNVSCYKGNPPPSEYPYLEKLKTVNVEGCASGYSDWRLAGGNDFCSLSSNNYNAAESLKVFLRFSPGILSEYVGTCHHEMVVGIGFDSQVEGGWRGAVGYTTNGWSAYLVRLLEKTTSKNVQ